MSGNSKLRASVLVDLVDRFSAGARKMAGLSGKLGKGLAGAQAELKQLHVKWEYVMSTVKLKSPVAAGDASVTELTLREPKVKDQLEVERIASIGRREAALFARLCDVDVGVIEELCIGDYKKLQEAYSDFCPECA